MIIDTNFCSTAHLAAFKRAGVTDIGRYIASGLEHESKVVKPAEAKAIAEAGLRLFLIYESQATESLRGAYAGRRDGEYALTYAKTIGAPKGAVIYATVDFDATHRETEIVAEYFAAFKDALEGYFQLGAYASGYVCNMLKAKGLINFRWLTMSMGFRGSRDAMEQGEFELRQEIDRKVAGLDVDPNSVHVASGYFGSFVPFGNVDNHDHPVTEVPHTDVSEKPWYVRLLGFLIGFLLNK